MRPVQDASRRENLHMSWTPCRNAFRLPDVDFAAREINVLPCLAQDLGGPETGESAEAEVGGQPMIGHSVMLNFRTMNETGPHLFGGQNLGVAVFQTAFRHFGEWISGDDFEPIAAIIEKPPRDSPKIVNRAGSEPL